MGTEKLLDVNYIICRKGEVIMNEKLLEEIKQFLDYAERESVIDIEVSEELKDFADYYIERIHQK